MAEAHTPENCTTSHTPTSTKYSASETAMFKKIITSGRSIKSQQRGEPDLSETELCVILHRILLQKPGEFLARFGSTLDDADLAYFDSQTKTNFEVGYRVGELRKILNQSAKSRMKTINNRRFKYLEKLMEESDYFCEEQMRQRDPYLFEYYIGQFLSEEEKLELDAQNKSDMKLSSMILRNMEMDRRAELLKQQRRKERDQIEETDSNEDSELSSDEDSEPHSPVDHGRDQSQSKVEQPAPMKLSSNPEMARREKLMLRAEFLAAMQNSFLDGKDKDFDYSTVDDNEKYDSLEMKQKDAEDEYFDTEEPSWCREEGEEPSWRSGEVEEGEEPSWRSEEVEKGEEDAMETDSADKQDAT